MSYKLDIEHINAPEDDFILTINDDTILYISQNEYNALVKGLQTNSIDKTFRTGEEMHVTVNSSDDGVHVDIECGYDNSVHLTLQPNEFHNFVSELEPHANK